MHPPTISEDILYRSFACFTYCTKTTHPVIDFCTNMYEIECMQHCKYIGYLSFLFFFLVMPYRVCSWRSDLWIIFFIIRYIPATFEKTKQSRSTNFQVKCTFNIRTQQNKDRQTSKKLYCWSIVVRYFRCCVLYYHSCPTQSADCAKTQWR